MLSAEIQKFNMFSLETQIEEEQLKFVWLKVFSVNIFKTL